MLTFSRFELKNVITVKMGYKFYQRVKPHLEVRMLQEILHTGPHLGIPLQALLQDIQEILVRRGPELYLVVRVGDAVDLLHVGLRIAEREWNPYTTPFLPSNT